MQRLSRRDERLPSESAACAFRELPFAAQHEGLPKARAQGPGEPGKASFRRRLPPFRVRLPATSEGRGRGPFFGWRRRPHSQPKGPAILEGPFANLSPRISSKTSRNFLSPMQARLTEGLSRTCRGLGNAFYRGTREKGKNPHIPSSVSVPYCLSYMFSILSICLTLNHIFQPAPTRFPEGDEPGVPAAPK